MIVEATGKAKRVHNVVFTATLQAFASTTGEGYNVSKKGAVRAIIRLIKKSVKKFNFYVVRFIQVVIKFMATRTGKPTSIDPPLKNQH